MGEGKTRTRLTRLGRYSIEGVLGVGGSATVYLATDTTIGKRVALKVLHEHLRDDPVTVRRFANDARALARLNHPNIVQVFAAELDQYYFAMEYVEGIDLERLIEEGGSLPPARGVGIAIQAAEALAHIHSIGLLHRDVKPGNIMIAGGDLVKLADFSIAREADETVLTLKGSLIGTVEYMAPEAIREEETDARADIYSLGAVLHECLTGRPPFEREEGSGDLWPVMERILKERPTPPAEADPSIPGEISDVVMRALEKDPGKRWETMETFASALRSAAGKADTVYVTPVVLSIPSEVDGKVRISWSPYGGPDFSRYEVHRSSDKTYAPSDATLIGTVDEKSETTFTADLPKGGGTAYYRVRTITRSGSAVISNRVSMEHGKPPPLWKRPAYWALFGVAAFVLVGSSIVAYMNRPEPETVVPVLEGEDIARISGSFVVPRYLEGGGISMRITDPVMEVIEEGPVTTEASRSMPSEITVEMSGEIATFLLGAGIDPFLMQDGGIEVVGRLSNGPSGLVIRPASMDNLVFSGPTPPPAEIDPAEWMDHEGEVVRFRSEVIDAIVLPSNTVYLVLAPADTVVVFTTVRHGLDRAGIDISEIGGRTVTVTGRPQAHPRYGPQIILAHPGLLSLE